MSLCKLTYFNLRALGEPIRMILAYAKIPFEDVRIERFGAEWPIIKPTVPLGQLPLLEIDGLKLHQSRAICRYLSKKCDIDGKNYYESVQIDIAADVIYDFRANLRFLREFDDPIMAQKKYDELNSSFIPLYLNTLDNMVKNNGGYLACGKLTWVDFYFTGGSEYYSLLARFNILEDHRHLRNLVEKVFALPELKDYLKNRPESES